MAAAEEADPKAHPDALRRRRTLRDAALAAKATAPSTGTGAPATGAPALGGDAADSGGGGEEGAAPWIGRRVLGAGGRSQVVAPDHSTARLSIGSRYSMR